MTKNNITNKYPSFIDIILFFVLYFTLTTVFGFVTAFFENIYSDIPGIHDILNATSYVIIFSLIISATSVYRNLKHHGIKPRRLIRKHELISPMYILFGILAIFSMSFITNPLVSLFPQNLGDIYDMLSKMDTYTLLSCVIAAPVLEELLFRGIIQSDLEHKYGGISSIIITSLVFSIIHINPAQVIAVFFTSVLISTIYYKTKSLWCCIIIHSFNNTAAYLLFKLYKDKSDYAKPYIDFFENHTTYYIIYSIAVLIVILTIVTLFATKKSTENKTIETPKDNNNQQNSKNNDNKT
ncbi:MAG: type II CAAX endopeptidase family protein [Rikenellaceae bacterium]